MRLHRASQHSPQTFHPSSSSSSLFSHGGGGGGGGGAVAAARRRRKRGGGGFQIPYGLLQNLGQNYLIYRREDTDFGEGNNIH